MSNTDRPELDDASTGGGIGDIGPQPVDPSSENPGQGVPDVTPDRSVDRGGAGMTRDQNPTPSGEDPDDEADDTLGTTV